VDAAGTLRDARGKAGLTQRELARLAGVPQPTVARIESGVVVPRVDTLDRLLAACGLALASVPRAGLGLDRTLIREKLRLTVAERARAAAVEWTNLQPFLRAGRR
jgi:transcriptional regulator with XRE-family HTH domain